MTLDFKKLILNNIRKQMKIQHFESNCQIFKKDELPENVQNRIKAEKGDIFLEDAHYTIWFSGNNITKEIIEKTIFKIVNSALGSSANDMNEKDLILIDLGGGTTPSAPQATPDEVDSMTSPEADAANADAITGLVGTGDEDKAEGVDDGLDPEAAEIVGDEPEPVTSDEIDSAEDDFEDEPDSGDVEPVTQDEIDSVDEPEDSAENDAEDEPENAADDEMEDADDEPEEDEDDDDADEMDDDEELDESVESPSAGEKFVLLKITMK